MIPEQRPKFSHTRSRRLRKKLHLDEFKEFGFDINLRLNKHNPKANAQEVLYAFIEKIEAAQLSCGGGGGPYKLHFFITQANGTTAREEDRITILEIVNSIPEIVQVHVSPLIDANYPDEP